MFIKAIFFKLTIIYLSISVLISSNVSFANYFDPDDFSIGGFVVEQLGAAVQGAKQASAAAAKMTARVQQARTRYIAALRSGRGVKQAGTSFARELASKDFHYLSQAVIMGVNSAQQPILARIAPVDGGIYPETKHLFDFWAFNIRRKMGAAGKNDLMAFSPQKFLTALQETRKEREFYLRARDRAELFRSGLPLDKLFSSEVFYRLIIDEIYLTQDNMWRIKNATDFKSALNPVYDEFARIYSKSEILRASSDVLRHASFSRSGELRPIEIIDVAPNKKKVVWNLFEAFLGFLKTSPRGYVVHIGSGNFHPGGEWEAIRRGDDYYRSLVGKFGEKRVLQASRVIWNARKNHVGELTDDTPEKLQKPRWWLEKLLDEPGRAPPSNRQRILPASNIEDIAKAHKKSRFATVAGRISRVRLSDGFADIDFVGATPAFYMILPSSGRIFYLLQKEFGKKLEKLPGTLVKVDGRIEGHEGRWWIRVFDRPRGNPISILKASEWPKGLTIPAALPKFSVMKRPPAPKAPDHVDRGPLISLRYITQMLNQTATYQAEIEFCTNAKHEAIKEKMVDTTNSYIAKRWSEYVRRSRRHIRKPTLQQIGSGYDRQYAYIRKRGVICRKKDLAYKASQFEDAVNKLRDDGFDYEMPALTVSEGATVRLQPSPRRVRRVDPSGRSGSGREMSRPSGNRMAARGNRRIARSSGMAMSIAQLNILSTRVANYRAVAEKCAGSARPEIVQKFLDRLQSREPEMVDNAKKIIKENFQKSVNLYARYKKCPKGALKSLGNQYTKILLSLK